MRETLGDGGMTGGKRFLDRTMDSRWIYVAALALVLVMVGQIVHAIRGESLTWDEGDHIFAGYESWKTHDYGLNPEHPPMVKMVATIPLLGLPLTVPALQNRFFKTESYLDGRQLLFHNGPADGGQYDSQTLVLRVRLFAMIFTILAALLVFSAAREMFGPAAGLVALTLFCFDPNLLAHGAYVTTDMAASCTMFATVYALWRWWGHRTWPRLLAVGLAAGLALAAKHSGVLLAPMLIVLAAGQLLADWQATRKQQAKRPFPASVATVAGALAVVVVVAVLVLWSFYGFRYAARPAGLALSPSLAGYVGPLAGTEAHGILLAGRLHLLPESWLYGLADVRNMANGMPSYFFGKVYAHGVWFYFPVLFTIKSTLGLLGLLLLTVVAALMGWLRNRRELWFLVAPPAIYLLVAMDSHLNIGARHILPVWIFCCVIASAGFVAVARRGRAWTWVVSLLLLAHVVTSVKAAPNYISYANEAWGGPTQTYRYLTDSNTDWAQQLVATSAYVREHHIQNCWIAYFAAPFILPADYGIPCKLLPTADTASVDEVLEVPPVIDGTVLVSAGTLNGFEFGTRVLNPYETMRLAKPDDFIQNGVFVFHGRFPMPLAASMAHTQRSGFLLKAKNPQGALEEAETAERLAPGEVQPAMAVGDAEAALGHKDLAAQAYARSQQAIDRMEPGAREIWTATLKTKQDAAR
jgi:hypothetical protein